MPNASVDGNVAFVGKSNADPNLANEVIKASDLDVPISYESFADIGSGLGSAGFIVYDDRTCMVKIAYLFSRFLSIESCGQCPPCKLGSSAITKHLEKIENRFRRRT